MMRLTVLSVAVVAATRRSGFRGDPLGNLLPVRAAASACFQRVYDADHMKQHPREAIRAVLVSQRRETKRPETS